MVSDIELQLFLSAVTADFRAHRLELKRDLSLPSVKVHEQDDFVQGSATLLETLDDYVRSRCHAVIHLVGPLPGATITAAEAAALRGRHPDFCDQIPSLTDEFASETPTLTYTQMEFWLSVYHKESAFVYVLEDLVSDSVGNGPHDVSQRRHWERVRASGKHWTRFSSTDGLCRTVLRDLHDRWPQRIPVPPVRLPYASLGSLFKGRDAALAQLHGSLRCRNGFATAIVGKAIHGLGGVGKTRLAVEYAWQYLWDYTAVLCLNAESPQALDAELASLVGPEWFNLAEKDDPSQEVQTGAAL